MKFRKSIWLVMFVIVAILLNACNLGATPAPTQDPGAVQTQAFNLVLTQAASQQTQTALVVPPTAQPTNTLLPTATLLTLGGATITPFAFNTQQSAFTPIASPIATTGVISTVTTKNGCNDGTYIRETPPLDGAEVSIGDIIKKGFTIKNTGTCDWDEGYAFQYLPDLSSPEVVDVESFFFVKSRPQDFVKVGHSIEFTVTFKMPKTAGEYKVFWKLRDEAGNFFGPLVYAWVRVRKP